MSSDFRFQLISPTVQVTLGTCVMLVTVTIMFETLKRYLQEHVPVRTQSRK